MPGYKYHIFICTNERSPEDPRGCCKARDSGRIRELFKSEVKRRGLTSEVRANAAGCLDHCRFGPAVVIYPEGVWYRVENAEDVLEVMDRHIEGGQIVERLKINGSGPGG